MPKKRDTGKVWKTEIPDSPKKKYKESIGKERAKRNLK
mgnify:CR=1 FL=1